MKKCKNCNVNDAVKYSKYTTGDFCSRECARSYGTKEARQEINEKVSKKLSGIKPNIIYTEEMLKTINKKRIQTFNNKILQEPYSSLSEERMKKRIVLEQNGKCNKCGLSEWLGEKIPLELEHIDGNHSNWERNNLEVLCPNCHAMTPTWRGRNQKNKGNKGKFTDEELLRVLINENFNIRRALSSLGLAAKGGNYKRCNRLIQEFKELDNSM